MTNLPDHLNVPVPEDAFEEEEQSRVDAAVDDAVNKAIDDDIDEMLKGF